MDDSDPDLLGRFIERRDQTAFAALVQRHAPLVLGICQRVLDDRHDAEDVAQAAFMVLASRAAGLERRPSLGPWLYGVALNLARRARRDRRSRERVQREASTMPQPQPLGEDLAGEIDAAMAALPARERDAITLFHLEGRPVEEVARMMDRPVGTVCWWLSRGRERLRQRLSRAGVAVSVTALAAALGGLGAAEIPAGFATATAGAATAFASAGGAAGPAATLASQGIKTMGMLSAIKSVLIAASLVAAVGAAGWIAATENGGGAKKVSDILGAQGFLPTPEHPVGWRGDWTGRYPGATPTTVWGRWARGASADLLNQSQKPGAKASASQPVRLGIVREWLVLGPFPAGDPASAMDHELAPNEAQMQPDAGEKIGGLAWKPLHVSMETQTNYDVNKNCCSDPWVNFEYLFGKTTNQVAYAHSYLIAKTAGKVELNLTFYGEAAKVWLNGNPLTVGPPRQAKRIVVDLLQGANRLLVKVAYGTPKNNAVNESIWRFCVGVLPTAPIAYDTRNVGWMTYLPGTTTSQPIVVGGRIFASFANSDLVCLDKADGRILWLRSNYQYDAMTAAERTAYPGLQEKVEPLLAKMRQVNDDFVKAINAAVSPSGVAPDHLAALKELLNKKDAVDKSIHNAVSALDAKKYPKLYESEVSACDATPCSDGKRVYAVYGGGRDKAGCLIVGYDLDGNRQWAFHEALGAGEHSNHASPLIIKDRLIHTVNKTILGFDAKTGEVKWRQTNPNWYLVESSAWPVRAGATEAIAVDQAIVRANDGQFLWTAKNGQDNFWHIIWHVPVFDNGVVYSLGLFTGTSPHESVTAVQLSEKAAGQWDAKIQWTVKNSDLVPAFKPDDFTPMCIASPLCHDGLLYRVDMLGLLVVLDAKTGARAYQHTLDLNQQFTRMDYGVCASPTLGGKHIFLLDGMGGAVVLEPGPAYKEVGRNVLEDFDGPLWGGQERFFTSPVFDGSSLLIRGRGYLYCIREK